MCNAYFFCKDDLLLIPVLLIIFYLSAGPPQTKSQEIEKNVQGMATLWKELIWAKHEISERKPHSCYNFKLNYFL